MVPYPVGGRHLDSRRRARPPSLNLPTLHLPYDIRALKRALHSPIAQLVRALH